MSVVYEPRSFMNDGQFTTIGMPDDHEHDHDHGHDQRFTDNDVADQLSQYTAEAMLAADRAEADDAHSLDVKPILDERTMLEDEQNFLNDDPTPQHDEVHMDNSRLPEGPLENAALNLHDNSFQSPVSMAPLPHSIHDSIPNSKDSSPSGDSPRSARNKNLPKPERPDVVKQADGKFHCTIEDCKEEVRSFARKCEWNKHMDKHERPYRCQVPGCESLPGFTYSGGLLRHEREVHGKYGGPKKTVKCPHPNCKRHSGKGFSRQENLNEHLRRVHTDMDGSGGGASPPTDGNSADGGANSADDNDSVRSGIKRKRRGSDVGDELAEMRNEMKSLREEQDRLRMENDQLRHLYTKMEVENKNLKIENDQQSQHCLSQMQQIAELQEAVRHGISGPMVAPTAQMI